MSYKSQAANMLILHKLMSCDLSYIFGERESGPNGEKKEFHTKGRAFLSALGKDLGFRQMDIRKNYGGIAVSGEIRLMGMWDENHGLYIQLSQDLLPHSCIMYRSIKHMKDYSGGRNQYISMEFMAAGDYEMLLSRFERMKENAHEHAA